MVAVRITHLLDGGRRAAELAPDVVKIEGTGGVMLIGSIVAHGQGVSEVDSTDTIEASDDEIGYARDLHDRRERRLERLRRAAAAENR